MKNNFLLLLSVIILLSFSNCMQDHPNESDVRKEVKVSASFKNSTNDAKVTTRAVDNAWEEGDAIGLYMKTSGKGLAEFTHAENAKYITTGTSSFAPASDDFRIYYPFNKSKVDFISYHPYTISLNGFNYEIDVSDQDDMVAIDLLYSDNVKGVNSDVESINLVFEHQLTKVVLKLNTNYTGKEQAGLTAKITNVNTRASFSLVDGSITTGSDPKDVSFIVNPEGTLASAIVLPDNSLANKELVITIDETNYSYLLSNSTTITSFEKAKQYEYTITIEPTYGPIIKGVTAEITDWTTVSEDISVVEEPPFITPPEEEGDPEAPSAGEGDGTEANPYTIDQALQKVALENNVWIKGFIVGSYTNGLSKTSFVNDEKKATKPRLALAFSKDETDCEKTFPVQLQNSHTTIENACTFQNRIDNLNKEVIFYGNIGFYYIPDKIFGVIAIKKAKIDGVVYSKY